MRIPVIVLEVGIIVLRDAFGKPAGDHERRNRIGDDNVGVSVQDIRASLRLVAQPLEVNRGEPPTQLHRGLDLDDVRELVGHDIMQPGMRASQFEIEGRSPELDLVIVEIRSAVGVVIVIADDEADLLIRLVLVHLRDRSVDPLRYRSDLPRGPLGPVMEVNEEMRRFNGLPREVGARIVIILRGKPTRQKNECDKKERFPRHQLDFDINSCHLVLHENNACSSLRLELEFQDHI